MIALELGPAAAITAAEDAEGLDDWDGDSFRGVLDLLWNSAIASRPNDRGLRMLEQRTKRTLSNRLELVRDRKLYPEIAEQRVVTPMVVLGLPRSGTTFLHALLAQDPNARTPLLWEATRPSPPPETATFSTDPRIALSAMETPSDPEFLKRHAQEADLPIECGPAFFTYEFLGMGNDAFWDVPDYRQRMQGDFTHAYRWHKQVVQHLQSRAPRSHWVFKCPEHVAHPVDLFTTYPDVRVVFTHRDPGVTFASLASLVAYFRKLNYAAPDLAAIGPGLIEYWRWGIDQMMAFRANGDRARQFCDIAYDELTAAPMKIVARIYAHFGIPLTPEGQAAMEGWLQRASQEKHRQKYGAHRYSAADYGLDADAVRERFADYIARYSIARD